jgi:hypothetical protein
MTRHHHPRCLPILLALFGWAFPAHSPAQVAIKLGTIQIPAGATEHAVDIQATGGHPISDMLLCFQIGDGGPLFSPGGTAGPKIVRIELTGSLWAGLAGGYQASATVSYPTQIQELSVATKTAGASVSANGRLCRLIIDAAGCNGQFPLLMSPTLAGNSAFELNGAPVASQITNGTLNLDGGGAPPVAPPVTLTRMGNGSVRLSFPSAVGATYAVHWDADLTPPWTPLAAPLTGTGGILTWTDDGSQTGTTPASVPRRFYMISVQP